MTGPTARAVAFVCCLALVKCSFEVAHSLNELTINWHPDFLRVKTLALLPKTLSFDNFVFQACGFSTPLS